MKTQNLLFVNGGFGLGMIGLVLALAISRPCRAQSDLPPLQPPLSISSPTNGAVFNTPATIQLAATVGRKDIHFLTGGGDYIVEFFAGTNDWGKGVLKSSSDFSDTWVLTRTNPPPENYALIAIAVDNAGGIVTSEPVNIRVQSSSPPPNRPPVVSIASPTNGETFTAPANILILPADSDPDGYVTTLEFFAGTNRLGILPLPPPLPPGSPIPAIIWPIQFDWSSVPAGNYVLTVVATDNGGLSTTSAPVNINVLTNTSATNPPPVISIVSPTNGETFTAPTNILILAPVVEPDGHFDDYLKTVEFFAGTNSLGFFTIPPLGIDNVVELPQFDWTNVPAGNYLLTAVAMDIDGLSTTSAPVNIIIQPPTIQPFNFKITGPANGAVFRAPINIPITAFAPPEGAFTSTTVEFFADTNSLGFGSPLPVSTLSTSTNAVHSNFHLVWTNAMVGPHVLTARMTVVRMLDPLVSTVTSAPVSITILPPLPPPANRPVVVNIIATDPMAVEGTNYWVWPGETNSPPTWSAWPTAVCRDFTNWGPKTATFTVRRQGDLDTNLTVIYTIGGTASNGVDYVALPGFIDIPVGESAALITVVPVGDNRLPVADKTVVLTLAPATNSPPDYVLGFPSRAAAVIVDGHDGHRPEPVTGMLPGGCFHFNANGPDGAWFSIEYSTNLVTWTPICTNQVINGSIDFIDSPAPGNPSRFYRAVPQPDFP